MRQAKGGGGGGGGERVSGKFRIYLLHEQKWRLWKNESNCAESNIVEGTTEDQQRSDFK